MNLTKAARQLTDGARAGTGTLVLQAVLLQWCVATGEGSRQLAAC